MSRTCGKKGYSNGTINTCVRYFQRSGPQLCATDLDSSVPHFDKLHADVAGAYRRKRFGPTGRASEAEGTDDEVRAGDWSTRWQREAPSGSGEHGRTPVGNSAGQLAGKMLCLPLSDGAVSILETRRREQEHLENPEFVFTTKHGKPYSPKTKMTNGRVSEETSRDWNVSHFSTT